MNFPLASVLQTPAKISQPARQKSCLQSCTNKNVVRNIMTKFFNEVHFLNMLSKNKFSKMNAILKNINT
jgi:hypothetical protein